MRGDLNCDFALFGPIHVGENLLGDVRVVVERKRVRRVNIRIGPDGVVALSLLKWGCSLAYAEDFLRSKWGWVAKTRAEMALRPPPEGEATDAEVLELKGLVAELHGAWCVRLGEEGVGWSTRRMKSIWGSCHIRRRRVVYSLELARKARELVEYVVVHELTHLRVADHGPGFQRLMDERLPGWRDLRRRLNRGR